MNHSTISNHFAFVEKVICWIIKTFKGFNDTKVGMVLSYLKTLEKISKDRGIAGLISYNKKVRQAFMNYLLHSKERIEGIRLDNSGLPFVLKGMEKYISDKNQLRLLLTVLYSTRALSIGKEPDYEPIIGTPIKEIPDNWDSYVKDFFQNELGFRKMHKVNYLLQWKRFHFSTKNGPNGQAMWTCLSDLSILPDSLLKSLSIIGGPKLENSLTLLKKYLDIFKDILPIQGSAYRKVTHFPDKEDKVRVIAILDYFSQTALKPLHHYLYKILKSIPQDCTFDQAAFEKKIPTNNNEVFYSVDLSNATDRFPILAIAKVFKGLFPDYYISAWIDVMVGYPFQVTKDKSISYGTGNPMGAYSSWASFAIAHHYLVYRACRISGISWKKANYFLLGDDIVIVGEQLGEAYLKELDLLGLPYSKAKTHKSKLGFEFAKRWFYLNEEISPFPISGLRGVMRRYNFLVNFLLHISKRGYSANVGIPQSVDDFYRIVMHFKSKSRLKILNKTMISYEVTKVISEQSEDLSSSVYNIYRSYTNKEFPYELNKEVCLNLFKSACLDAFAESNSSNNSAKGLPPLGKLAEDLVILITSNPEIDLNLIYSLPLLAIHGQVEEEYLRLNREAFEIDTIRSGDWPLTLRAMTIPISDRVYVIRNYDLFGSLTPTLGKRIAESLKSILSYPNLLGEVIKRNV